MKGMKSEKVSRSFRTTTDDNARGNDIVANTEKTKKKVYWNLKIETCLQKHWIFIVYSSTTDEKDNTYASLEVKN